MSVYIPGMEMPKSGAYFCELGVLDESTAVLTIFGSLDEPQRSYKIVPVPPHGRLIDADALEMERRAENAKKGWHDSFAVVFNGDPYYEATYDCTEQFKELVNNAPTVIPADEPFGKSEQLNV